MANNQSHIEHHVGGTSFVGADAVSVFRCIAVAGALELYAKTGMKANRAYTPSAMLAVVEQITGKKFKRGQYMEAAAALREYASLLRSGIPETVSPELAQDGG